MKIQIKKLPLLILIIAFLSLGVCAQSKSPVPANFTTYTDETNFFSISYPENWEPDFSRMKTLKQEAANLLKSIDAKGSFEKSNMVFLGGVPLGSGYYNPSINILVEPLGDDNAKLEDFVDSFVQEYKRILEEYHEFSRTKTIIDGRQAVILDFEARMPNFPLVHFITMNIYIDKFLWTITCSVGLPLNFYDFKNDLYAMVKSFKILK